MSVNNGNGTNSYGDIAYISEAISAALGALSFEGINNKVEVDEGELEKLALFVRMVLEANEKMNLTGAADVPTLVRRHIADSLVLHFVAQPSKDTLLLDIGTGAGFPGLPLSIVGEGCYYLLDSLNKRIKFLQSVVDELELNNVSLIWDRAEDYIRKQEVRAKFDIVTSRAVAPLRLLFELCLPYVKKDGCFYAFKGSSYKTELDEAANAMKQLNAELEAVYPYKLGNEQLFYLLKFRLKSSVADKYPRKAGLPAKKPL